MSDLEIHWPDDGAERVRAARGRLARAGEALRARSLSERLALVARVLQDWTQLDSPWRRELVESFAGTTSFSRGVVAEGIESALRAWQPRQFVEAAERELASVACDGGARSGSDPRARTDRLVLAPFEWTAVLAGGTIPMPTLLSSLLPLVVGSPVLLRESSKDSVTGRLLARSLAARDAALARAFAPIEFPWDDESALDALLEAPCIVATGTDETMRAIANRLAGHQRFVAYGHRVSLVVLGRSLPFDLDRVSRAIALDVARWDQTGCLSPVAVLLVGFDDGAATALARACHLALEACSASMPRGELSTEVRAQHAGERAEARMRAASGRSVLFEGSDSTIVLESDARARSMPLYRFLRLMPVPSVDALDAALAALGAPLSSVAVDGFSPSEQVRLEELLAHHGTSRVTRPGRLQTPPIDWPRDGMPLLTPVARFVRSELISRE